MVPLSQKASGMRFPDQYNSPFSARMEEVLLLCFYDPMGISTVPETVAFMQSCSVFSITVLNLFEHGKKRKGVGATPKLNLTKFKGIVIHNSVSYNVSNLRAIDRLFDIPLRKYAGVKVLLKQDENFKFKELAEYIGETSYDLIFTCLPAEAIDRVYPPKIVGRPKFLRMLTGYVTPTLRGFTSKTRPRKTDVGYRGSIQPLTFGRLAYEKRKIGDDFTKLAHGKGLITDISSRWEDRLGADAWFEFLSSCKATLGVESGASIFDLDGNLAERCQRADAKYGAPRDDPEYIEQYLGELADLEGAIYYNQISPRHFEAAATRTLQIMYEGIYSDIFVEGRHYVKLNRDGSNIDEVIEILRDDKRREEIIECAHQEIIQNKEFWIETFVSKFDAIFGELLAKKQLEIKPSFVAPPKKANVLVLVAHKPSLDPRIAWIASGAPEGFGVTQLGVLAPGARPSERSCTEQGHLVLTEEVLEFNSSMLAGWRAAMDVNSAGWAGFSEVNLIASLVRLGAHEFSEFFLAPCGALRTEQFRGLLTYFLNTTSTLLASFHRLRGIDAVIAADLATLPAALIIKGLTGIPVIYDAHEYWPEADVEQFEFEKQFWTGMEARLVPHADRRQTVSPGLAQLMSMQYQSSFEVVPNCEPIKSAVNPAAIEALESGQCRFIFQGNFAPKRGLDILVEAWPATNVNALLVLRGPDSPYKQTLIERAKELGLLERRIFFPDPVPENKLVSAAQEGHVGLVPYTPSGQNYSNCCPNKLSQYMAAGLPIFANRTRYVEQVVKDAGNGLVIDFGRPADILSATSWFVENQTGRQEMGKRGHVFFLEVFNWNTASKSMYESLGELTSRSVGGGVKLFDSKPRTKLFLSPSIWAVVSSGVLAGTLAIWMSFPPVIRVWLRPAVKPIVKRLFGRE